MVVIGTPVIIPGIVGTQLCPVTTGTVPCAEQNQRTPAASQFYRMNLPSRMRSVRGRIGQKLEILWTLLDSNGTPVDLLTCGFPDGSSEASVAAASIVCRLRESMSLGLDPGIVQIEYEAVIVDAATGQIQILLPSTATSLPGIYYAEVAVIDSDDQMLFSNVFYLVLERGQFAGLQTGGPPTVAEIRLHLRDSAPEESLLLDNVRVDDAEIALAVMRPIEYWNELPPDLGAHTTQNFPYRFHWMDGAAACLFWMVEEQFRANNLEYSAAGVQVNDQNKEANYARAAERRWANWVNFVRRKKSELNYEGCWGGIGSQYSGSYSTVNYYYDA
jgi:hypothetical protein